MFGGVETVAASELKGKVEESQPGVRAQGKGRGVATRHPPQELFGDCNLGFFLSSPARFSETRRGAEALPLGPARSLMAETGSRRPGERRFLAKPMTTWATWAVSRSPIWGCMCAEEAQGRRNKRSADSTDGPACEEGPVAAVRVLLGGGDLLFDGWN
ncbi:uncharacterized protein LOC144715164 [Wolffia australiana]